MRDNIRIVLPIIVLGYAPTKLFSVLDERGKGFIPIFTSPERATEYLEHFSTDEKKLHHYVLSNLTDAASLLQTIKIIDLSIEYVTLNPFPPTVEHGCKSSICMKIAEAIQRMVEDHSNGSNDSSSS